MAKQTNLDIRNMTFYQVFPRNHSKQQNFQGVIDDLERIKGLGVDVLYLLPIHPIGEKARKGLKGSPYAIKDYYGINSEYGNLNDFEILVSKAHDLGLKVMIDIVINHTSRDSILTKEHPDWFYHNEKGDFANRVGDWSDITDLDYNKTEVWSYLTEMLIYWAQKVDGFRCDVAPLIPLDFWSQARNKIDLIKLEFIWLTESVHPEFIKYLRDMGFECHSDSEMYQVFDVCYDYDIFDSMDQYLKDPSLLDNWIENIRRQETTYPSNYIKLRSFENHDQKRLRSKTRDETHFKEMLSLEFFLKGAAFIYGGMEHQATHEPTLFDDDLIQWNKTKTVEPLIQTLAKIKKDPLLKNGRFDIVNIDGVVEIKHQDDHSLLYGVFNLENKFLLNTELKDGTYKNLINDEEIKVKNKEIILGATPIIIKVEKG